MQALIGIGEALFSGTTASLSRPRQDMPVDQLLSDGTARLHTGHYLSGMIIRNQNATYCPSDVRIVPSDIVSHYAGEFYWGVDVLRHLEGPQYLT